MTDDKLTGKALHNVHKVVFLANEYPTHDMKKISKLMPVGPLDFNAAAWRAQDMGLLTINKDKSFTVEKVPEKWELGPEIQHLRETLMYYFKHLARFEADIEEVYLSNITMAYEPHDVLIITKQLLNERVIATYDITSDEPIDPEKPELGTAKSTYTFFTLWENLEQRWGAKQFKNVGLLS